MIAALIILVLAFLLYGVGYKSGIEEGYKAAHIDIVETLRKDMTA